MTVDLTPDQKASVRDTIASDRLHDEMDAIRDARARVLILADVNVASLARGEGRAITPQSMDDFAAEAKKCGRARLAAEQASKT